MVHDVELRGAANTLAAPPASYRLGLWAVTLSAVAWSLAGYFTRLIRLDSWTMLAWRGVFGGLALAAVIVAMEPRRGFKAFRMGWSGWLFAAISGVAMIFFITSFGYTSVAHVAVIYATVPFVAAALAWSVLGERPAREAVLASAAALAGVAVMVGFSLDGGFLGDALAFGMTSCMALLMVMTRRFPAIPTMPAACVSAILSGLVCWPLGHPLAVTTQDLGMLALFGVVNSAVGLALFTLGAKHLPAIETALIGSLDAPLAPLWVWLAFGETPGLATVVGGLVVFVAVAVHILVASRRT